MCYHIAYDNTRECCMNTKTECIIKYVTEYDVNRAYIGQFTGAGLSEAIKVIKQTQDWDNPKKCKKVLVGYVDGPMICHKLWTLMLYNTKRFGTKSPFLNDKGVADIKYFCDKKITSDMPEYRILGQIQSYLKIILANNGCADNRGLVIRLDQDNSVFVRLINGWTNDRYKTLAALRDVVKFIIFQNKEDFAKTEYRSAMLDAVKCFVAKEEQEKAEEQARQERMDDAEDNAKITTDYRTRPNVPFEQYVQAVQDLAQIKQICGQNSK